MSLGAAGWVVFAACAASTPSPSRLVGTSLLFELPALDGRSVDLADHRGQVVLVDIWATWCTPCVASMPAYAGIYDRHKASGFSVLAVSVDQDDAEVRRFAVQHGVPFTILRDPQGSLPERIQLRTMPTALLVGREGHVAFLHEGFVPGDEVMLEREIVALLDASALASTSTESGP